MSTVELLDKHLARIDPRIAAPVFERLKRIPAVRRAVEREMAEIMARLRPKVKPYEGRVRAQASLPEAGRPREELLEEMRRLQAEEEPGWREGRVSGAVYHGGAEHVEFASRVYALHSQTNPLHADVWPSIARYEAEIVSMTAHMLGAAACEPGEIVGSVSSGGTESILLAVKSYRDRARAERRIDRPELIVPVTAHVAFDKAAHYFGIELVRTPVGPDERADVGAVRRAITRRTIAVVGSAPCFPYGVVDPIRELSELAGKRRIGCHVDACLGGFLLPWAERLGHPVPVFDFRLPGVTSISADTHKYGYAPKGTSVVLYRGAELRRYQYFTATEWPGGLYFSPTLAGSRPGALSAACWATMVSLGAEGYMEATRRILEAAEGLRRSVRETPGLRLVGDSLFVVAFASDSDSLDIYQVLDGMTERGWSLNGLHRPPCLHVAVTLRHAEPGVVERFARDLAASVEQARTQGKAADGMAPVYGLAGRLPVRAIVGELLRRYIDLLYEV